MAHLIGWVGWARDGVGSDGGVNDDDMLAGSGESAFLKVEVEALLTVGGEYK